MKKRQECSRVARPKIFAYEEDDVTSSDDHNLNLHQLLDSHYCDVTFSSSFESSFTSTSTSIPIQIKRFGKFNTKNVNELKPIIKRRKSPNNNENKDKEIGDSSNHHHHHHLQQDNVTKHTRRASSTVSFLSVEIREYDQTLGNNPSCTNGPPIALDYNCKNEIPQICLEQYEKDKDKQKRGRKYRHTPRLKEKTRIHLLQNQLGYTEDEINTAIKQTKELQCSQSLSQSRTFASAICSRYKRKFSKTFSFLQRRFKSDGVLHHKDNDNHIVVAELDMEMRNTIRTLDTISSTEPSIFVEPTLEL